MTTHNPFPQDDDGDGIYPERVGPYDYEWSELVQSMLMDEKPKKRFPKVGSAILGLLFCAAFWSAVVWGASAILANANIFPHALGFVNSVALGLLLLASWITLRAMTLAKG